MTDEEGYRIESAMDFGFQALNGDCTEYKCTEAALIAFAKACERKGLADVRKRLRDLESQLDAAVTKNSALMSGAVSAVADNLDVQIVALDAELTPIREAEEERFMTAQGYRRATEDEPGARWVKEMPPLCDDEGCPHHGTEHVCVSKPSPLAVAHRKALETAEAFEDAAAYEETMWTGWGDCTVPPYAEMRRVKAQQAVCALRDAQKTESR